MGCGSPTSSALYLYLNDVLSFDPILLSKNIRITALLSGEQCVALRVNRETIGLSLPRASVATVPVYSSELRRLQSRASIFLTSPHI